MSSSDLTNQLRLVLEKSPNAPSLSALLEYVDVFVKDRGNAPNVDAISLQIEQDLQKVCDDVIDHKVTYQLEVFLAVIFHLHPLLQPLSVISCWFELIIRPALREPKLATPAVDHAKELILATLDFSIPEENWDDEEKGKQREKVGSFRRRLIDFYLLDAYNESSSDDVLEWASLDDLSRERNACWKANLQDILVKSGLQRPKELLTEVYRCFATPSSRLQLVQLLNAFTTENDFPDSAASVMSSHMVTQSLLHSLTFDNSTTLCTVGLTLLTKLLPIFAVKACEDLKRILPWLFVVLARMICWKQRSKSTYQQLTPADLGLDAEIVGETVDTAESEFIDNRNKLPIRPDLEWDRLDLVFGAAVPIPPSPHQFFQFLYYLFPCNTLRFLRCPVTYLNENNEESPYTLSWEEALDEAMIRSKAEPLLRGHIVHPLLLWRDADSELSQPDFWSQFDISRIVAECTMLDVRNASLGMRELERQYNTHVPPSKVSLSSSPKSNQASEPISVPALSSSVESSSSSLLAQIAHARVPKKPRISLQEMINTAVALKSGLDVEVVDSTPTWPTNLFRNHAGTQLNVDVEDSGTVTPNTATLAHREVDPDNIPAHFAQAIAELQREALLLRSELNFELWLARENVKHIGRLYHERVISRNAEVERQGLHNKMRELKAEVHRLQKELKDHKDQTAIMKKQNLDHVAEVQKKISDLRAQKSLWSKKKIEMQAADKELKDTFAAQGKLLADATNNVFQLKTRMQENSHKIERLHDYELQIEQLIKMQRLWETDVQQLNEQNEYLKIVSSQYRKMELQVETYQSVVGKMEEDTKLQRLQIQTLETKLKYTQNQLDVARRMPSQSDLSEYNRRTETLTQANQKLREDNNDLNEEVEELQAMVESLKARVAGNRDLTSPARSSPLTSHPSPSMFL